MPPTLRTPRLLLSPLEDRDLTALHAHWNDPQVARFLWDAAPVPLPTVADVIARSSHTFQTSDWGLWSLRPAGEPPLIGVCGLSPFQHGDGVELLYSLTPSHWSKGLATEAATAVLAHAFETLALPEVLATTDDANTPSIRPLTRLGATPGSPGPVRPPHLPLLHHPPRYAPFRPP
ncbi:MAG TPA: GNAT family protein [Actinomycetota bacterium]|nr:GNAT family protein [Actinomycetota bacterium]